MLSAALWVAAAGYRLGWGRSWSLDLRVYRAAGHALFHGQALYTVWFTPDHLAFTYPPFALLVLSPLSLGPLWLVASLWWIVNAAALVAVVHVAVTGVSGLRGGRALAVSTFVAGAAILLFEPLRSDMDYGQVNLLLILLVLVDLLHVRGRGRGVLVGLAAAVKLTPLVYLLYFVVRRERAPLARAVGAAVGATALGWAVLPRASARYWFHDVGHTDRIGKVANVYNQSWAGALHRLPGLGGHAASVLWALCAVLTVAVAASLASVLARAGATVEAVLALAMAELLASPISWTHHWSWIAVVPVVLAARLWATPAVCTAAVVLVLVAVVAPYTWLSAGWLGRVAADSLTGAGALFLATWAVAERRSARRLPVPVPARSG